MDAKLNIGKNKTKWRYKLVGVTTVFIVAIAYYVFFYVNVPTWVYGTWENIYKYAYTIKKGRVVVTLPSKKQFVCKTKIEGNAILLFYEGNFVQRLVIDKMNHILQVESRGGGLLTKTDVNGGNANEQNKNHVKSEAIVVELAGTLEELLTEYSCPEIRNLKLAGEINAVDFCFMKENCISLETLDMKNVRITSYRGEWGTLEEYNRSNEYEANEIPPGSFFYWLPIEGEIGMSSLREVVLPANIVTIGSNAFAKAYNLKSINFPEGLIAIGNGSFYTCTSLDRITLPSTLKQIGLSAFQGCSSLSKVYLFAVEPPSWIGENAFADIGKDAVLFVPQNSLERYKQSRLARYFTIKPIYKENEIWKREKNSDRETLSVFDKL